MAHSARNRTRTVLMRNRRIDAAESHDRGSSGYLSTSCRITAHWLSRYPQVRCRVIHSDAVILCRICKRGGRQRSRDGLNATSTSSQYDRPEPSCLARLEILLAVCDGCDYQLAKLTVINVRLVFVTVDLPIRIEDLEVRFMMRFITTVVALFALVMMVMPSVASAGVVVQARPVVVHEAVVPAFTPAPFTTVEYFRPWACANPHYRRHHRWRCGY